MLSVTPPVIEISQQIQQLEIIVTSLLNSLPTYQHQMFHISDHLHLQSPTTIHIIINTRKKGNKTRTYNYHKPLSSITKQATSHIPQTKARPNIIKAINLKLGFINTNTSKVFDDTFCRLLQRYHPTSAF